MISWSHYVHYFYTTGFKQAKFAYTPLYNNVTSQTRPTGQMDN